jgi:hypothetical protein
VRSLRYPVVLAALAAISYATLRAQTPDAAQVLTAARTALGGGKSLSAVKTFTITGRTRQLRGNNLVPIEFELNCELPDKYVRVDEFPAQDADPTTAGFNGDVLIQIPRLPAAPAPPEAAAAIATTAANGQGAALSPAERRVLALKQDFARLTLGMFAASFPSYPLTFKYAGEAQAPEGTADVLDVAGPGNFTARLLIQRETHLPVMTMWNGPPATGPGAAGAPPRVSAAPTEYRIYYGDFRSVDGMKFPFRLRRAVAGETVEETTVDRIRINPKIDSRKFEASK